MSLRSAGKTDGAKLFSEALETTTTTRALNIRKAWAAYAENVLVLYAPEQALSFFTKDHLTKRQHKKCEVQTKKCNIYSSYHVIKAAKEEYLLLTAKYLFGKL